jgi:hypothetical protein
MSTNEDTIEDIDQVGLYNAATQIVSNLPLE